MMIPIGLCSVLAMAIILERAYRFHQARGHSETLVPKLRELVAANRFDEALEKCRGSRGLVAQVLGELIRNRYQSLDDLEKRSSIVGSRYLRDLSRYLRGLAVIGSVTPLMGLLGTVFGMVRVFIRVADLSGNANPSILASGIWEALLTTAAGLTVAIPALIAYHYFEGRVDDYSFRVENDCMELLQTLKGRQHDQIQQEKKGRD